MPSAKIQTAAEIRQAFLDYFRRQGHEIVESGPLVPANDPTLMFTNAGMVQFKDVFTGRDSRPYRRAATSQKCIRISGKHNDLENVGVTARHHTFFEMLGNFSFGDYFKEEAIAFAWEFLTRDMQIRTDRLVVTVFAGEGNLPPDEEAERLWQKISGLSSDRVLRCGKADNFWQMGDTGPCGPCSEVHYFIGDGDADPSKFGEEPSIDGRGWTEIWNLVFTQFDQQADGRMEPLPAPSVDTGMGLERLSVLQQGVTSNYDTDQLRPLVDRAASLASMRYRGTLDPDDVSMRVVADHARMAAFCISEGIVPGNSARSYVLRRVMRRAIYHGDRLGIDRAFFDQVTDAVVDLMGGAYPQLVERRDYIAEQTRLEEEAFRRTLARGRELLERNTEWVDQGGERRLPGKVAFTLYDTFGFPVDLQAVVGREHGFSIDQAGYDEAMAEAKARSKGSKTGDAAVADVYYTLHHEHGDTEFVGYEKEEVNGTVVALIEHGRPTKSVSAGSEVEVLLSVTPFYAESGGQVGDTGWIETAGGRLDVVDTQKPLGGLIVHRATLTAGTVSVGEAAALRVDAERRTQTRRNHSATHLLHYALRKVLGPQAVQQGSLVGPDRLRFDYTSSQPLALEQITEIEDLVNEKILVNAQIETEVLPIDEAKKRGAIGIFEEKYGDVVRMLTMTPDSIELCGGTHAARTGDIGLFKLLSDTGVSAGVRRIEAATGWNALRHVRDLERELGATAALVKAPPMRPLEKVERLLAQQKELQREVERLQKSLASGGNEDLTSGAQEVDGVRFLGSEVSIGDPKALREMADQLRDRLAPAVILLGTAGKGGKALLACSVSRDVTDRFHAGAIIKRAAAVVGGGGGGRPDFAQAGGSDASKLADAVRTVYPT